MARTALVTGGNRGIGLEACRQLAESGMRVVLAARDAEKGEDAARKLRDGGLEVCSEQLDVAESRSVGACIRRLADAGLEIDVLVNNAGVYPTDGVFSVSEETFETALEVNAVGPFRTCRALVLGMVQRGYGRVVNVSSGGGSFGEGLGPGGRGSGEIPERRSRILPNIVGSVGGAQQVVGREDPYHGESEESRTGRFPEPETEKGRQIRFKRER